jgi:hypothetical protein
LLSTPKQPQDSNLLLKNKYWEMTMNASTTRYVIGITTFLFMPNKIVNPSIASNITNMKTLTNAFDDERVNPNRLKARESGPDQGVSILQIKLERCQKGSR